MAQPDGPASPSGLRAARLSHRSSPALEGRGRLGSRAKRPSPSGSRSPERLGCLCKSQTTRGLRLPGTRRAGAIGESLADSRAPPKGEPCHAGPLSRRASSPLRSWRSASAERTQKRKEARLPPPSAGEWLSGGNTAQRRRKATKRRGRRAAIAETPRTDRCVARLFWCTDAREVACTPRQLEQIHSVRAGNDADRSESTL